MSNSKGFRGRNTWPDHDAFLFTGVSPILTAYINTISRTGNTQDVLWRLEGRSICIKPSEMWSRRSSTDSEQSQSSAILCVGSLDPQDERTNLNISQSPAPSSSYLAFPCGTLLGPKGNLASKLCHSCRRSLRIVLNRSLDVRDLWPSFKGNRQKEG